MELQSIRNYGTIILIHVWTNTRCKCLLHRHLAEYVKQYNVTDPMDDVDLITDK